MIQNHPVGNRFRAARGEQTLSFVEQATGVSRGLISRIEHGFRGGRTHVSVVARLARHYGVSIDYLMGA